MAGEAVTDVILSEAKDLHAAACRSLFGVARAVRALPFLVARGAGASAERLRLQIGDLLRAQATSRSFASLRMTIVALLGMTVAASLGAQVAPNKRYYTIHTTHFYIHFTSATEPTARRVAVDAERAYAELASELHPPRGSIDVVISDDADYSNG